MANVDGAFGARPIGTLDGSPWNSSVRSYPVDSSNGTAIFPGDFIKLEDDGNVAPAAATNAILGVCVGVVVDRAVPNTEHPGYLPASTAGNVLVCVGKDVLYEIQEDGNMASGGARTVIGSNGDIVAGAGSTTTGRSAHELDSSDVTTNDTTPASAQLRVIDYVHNETNDPLLSNAKWIVMINEHQLAEGGIGL
jgi:hypothetical protein